MDIVKRLRNDDPVSGVRPTLAMEAADEIERLRRRVEVLEMDYGHSVKEGIDLAKGWKDANDQAERMRGALQKIAAVDDEKLPTPVTQAEGVLWSTLDACVGLARKALREKK